MTKTRTPRRHRRAGTIRVLGAFGVLVLASAAGAGAVVGAAALSGPTNSDSAADASANQAAATVSLPLNEPPAPVLERLADDAPMPSSAGMHSALSPALNNPNLGEVAVEVIDPASDSVLYSERAKEPMVPGSVMKLYTAAAAAVVLEPGSRITTSVVQGNSPTEIVVIAGGDPTLRSGSKSTYNPGSASIKQLANQLNDAGITEVTKVTVDNSVFSGPVTASGWGEGDAPSTYAAEIYPFMTDGGRSTPSNDASMRHADPDLYAAQLLADALDSPDADVERGEAGEGAQQLAAVESAPIEQLIEQMLLISDNTLAECLGRLVALETGHPPSFDGATQAITDTMQDLGVDLTGYTAYDASGLSVDDRTSAASVSSVMDNVVDLTDANLDAVASGLPVSGYSGTLADRYDNGTTGGVAGRVRGKTGTLSGVASLSGTVVTNDGRLLVFSFLSNDGGAQDATRAALDLVAATIAGCGCH